MGILSALRERVGAIRGRDGAAGDAALDGEEPPLRAEIFGPDQLEAHAKSLAAEHSVDPKPGPERLLRRLAENDRIIRESHKTIVETAREHGRLGGVAEWLLDNFYLIEEQVALARDVFPPGYSRELPWLRHGPLKGYPRVYDVALELVIHTDGRVDLENLTRFVKAYQTAIALEPGRTLGVADHAPVGASENLRRVANRVVSRQRQQALAKVWARRFLDAAPRAPELLITELAEFVRSNPPLSAPFIAAFTADIEGESPALRLIINWIEQKLSERGQTLETIQRAESQEEAADQVSIGGSISSLRVLSAVSWRDAVESLSATDAALRRDPLGVYGQMDFRSRDRYRRLIEKLARRSKRREEEVAEAAIHLAADRRRKPEAEQRESHVGYLHSGRRARGARARVAVPSAAGPADRPFHRPAGAAAVPDRHRHPRRAVDGAAGHRMAPLASWPRMVAGARGDRRADRRFAAGRVAGELARHRLLQAETAAADGLLEGDPGRASHGRGGADVAGLARIGAAARRRTSKSATWPTGSRISSSAC